MSEMFWVWFFIITFEALNLLSIVMLGKSINLVQERLDREITNRITEYSYKRTQQGQERSDENYRSSN